MLLDQSPDRQIKLLALFRAYRMFEIGIFCVIALAIGYWGALWFMTVTMTYCMATSFTLNSSRTRLRCKG